MEKKGFLQISFPWLFALIVGAFILFLAIYASTQIIETEKVSLDAKTAKEIGILLDPLETGFETARTTSITVPSETRIHNRCTNEGYFGRQIIKVSQKTFDQWSETDINVGFSNKHIFSEENVEGKKFLLFSKPFDFPFKVADLIYLTSAEKEYCFENPPSHIKNEISNINQENLKLTGCSSDSIKVCFDNLGNNCDINVQYDHNIVEKNGDFFTYYGDTLMYAAIFSDKDVYECQLKRVMQRGVQLTQLYLDKADFVSSREQCNSNLRSELLQLRNSENSFNQPPDLNGMIKNVENIEIKNSIAECKLW